MQFVDIALLSERKLFNAYLKLAKLEKHGGVSCFRDNYFRTVQMPNNRQLVQCRNDIDTLTLAWIRGFFANA